MSRRLQRLMETQGTVFLAGESGSPSRGLPVRGPAEESMNEKEMEGRKEG